MARFLKPFLQVFHVLRMKNGNYGLKIKSTVGAYISHCTMLTDKIIVLLTDAANSQENCQQIRQLEADLFNNTVNIFTMGVGESKSIDVKGDN